MIQPRRVRFTTAGALWLVMMVASAGCKTEQSPPAEQWPQPPPAPRRVYAPPSASASPSASAKPLPRPMPEDAPPPLPTVVSLYERLGTEKGIAAVVDDAINRALADPKVNFPRVGVADHAWSVTDESVARVKRSIVQFLAAAAGGPQTYEGRPMKAVHAGMQISDAEFDALAADLRASLQKSNVPQRDQNELLAIVELTRRDVVEVK